MALEMCCQFLIGIYIDFAEGDGRIFVGCSLENWRKRFARATPAGPEIQHHDIVRLDQIAKAGVGHLKHCHEHSLK